MRKPLAIALATVLSLVAAVAVSLRVTAGDGHDPTSTVPPVHHRWTKEAVDLFAKLPIQEGGRVKPLYTFARFSAVAINGKEGVKTPDGDLLSPTEWFMDCVFFPDVAVTYECFVLQDSTVLDDVGLPHDEKSRRDRYSYDFLRPARGQIGKLAGEYAHIEAKDRTPVQGQLVNLAQNINLFESIATFLSMPLQPPQADESPLVASMFGIEHHASLAPILARAGELRSLVAAQRDPHDTSAKLDDPLRDWIARIVGEANGMALIPPSASAQESSQWLTPGDIASQTLYEGASMPDEVAALADLERMFAARDKPAEFQELAGKFRDFVIPRAESRGEYGKVPLEVTFYRADFFYYGLIVFVLGFIAAAVSWIAPSKTVTRLAAGSAIVGFALVTAGITMRCIIRSRPPVSTLYESVLFIAAVAVLVMLITEYVNRRGIALALANVLGAGGMFLASRYEMTEKIDTMPSLVAVLDTNFWLSTHVTTVTIGYGAGLLAGAVGHIYVLGKVFGLKKDDPAFYKSLSTMTYGMLCFGLLFSVVGTILGGIWANDSWGRFWGWDPKENGALTIVLWEIIILHARMGGFIRDFGMAMASVFGAAVVASSWWGVNLLGVGLHSYGFTSGIVVALLCFYGVEAVVLLAGGIWNWATSSRAAPTA